MVAASLTEWLVLFHLLGAFLLVAGVALAGVAFESARRQRPPSEVALLLGLGRWGVALVGIGSLLTSVFGLWLADESGVGLGAGWVDASIALFVLMAVLGGIGGQFPKRARLLAERLGDQPGESEELAKLLNDRGARVVNYASAVLLFAILVLMVFRPGGS